MRFSRWLYLLTFFLLPQSYLSAQGNADIKYGKITAVDFDLSGEFFDPSVKSVLTSNTESTGFEVNHVTGFRRIHNCLNREGSELAFFKMKSKS